MDTTNNPLPLFYLGVTGNFSRRNNTSYFITKDMFGFQRIKRPRQARIVLVLDKSAPSEFAEVLAPKFMFDTLDMKNATPKEWAEKCDTILFYDLADGEKEDKKYEDLMDLEHPNVILRGYKHSKEPAQHRTDGDPYAFYHNAIRNHWKVKRIPFSGVRIFQQIDIRPPMWIGQDTQRASVKVLGGVSKFRAIRKGQKFQLLDVMTQKPLDSPVTQMALTDAMPAAQKGYFVVRTNKGQSSHHGDDPVLIM